MKLPRSGLLKIMREKLFQMVMPLYGKLKQNPAISREEIAEMVSKTVRTVQRALGSLTEKGYIKRVGAKKNSTWEVLKEKH